MTTKQHLQTELYNMQESYARSLMGREIYLVQLFLEQETDMKWEPFLELVKVLAETYCNMKSCDKEE